MTSPAPAIPQRLTPRPSRRRRVAGLAALAAAAVVAAAVGAAIWWVGIRDPPPGPLTGDGISEAIGIGRHPGEVWTYGHPLAWNTGTEPVQLQRIWLVDPPDGLEVLETRVAGPGRKLLSLTSSPKWPDGHLTDLHPVAGFRVAPRTQPDGERGVELVYKLRTGKPGNYAVRAVGVDYTVGGDAHRVYLSYGLGVCVTAASKPLDRNCRPPEPLSPEEIDE